MDQDRRASLGRVLVGGREALDSACGSRRRSAQPTLSNLFALWCHGPRRASAGSRCASAGWWSAPAWSSSLPPRARAPSRSSVAGAVRSARAPDLRRTARPPPRPRRRPRPNRRRPRRPARRPTPDRCGSRPDHRADHAEVGRRVGAWPRRRAEHDLQALGHGLRQQLHAGRHDPRPVDLSTLGFPEHPGVVQGGPVEAAFSPDGRDVYVSNYSMYGPGFAHPGDDTCSPVAEPRRAATCTAST